MSMKMDKGDKIAIAIGIIGAVGLAVGLVLFVISAAIGGKIGEPVEERVYKVQYEGVIGK